MAANPTRNALARVASKNRRDNEAVEIQKLVELLPFTHEEQKGLEKEAIVRLTIAYIRLRQLMIQERETLVGRAVTGAEQATAAPTPGSGPLPLPSPQEVSCGQREGSPAARGQVVTSVRPSVEAVRSTATDGTASGASPPDLGAWISSGGISEGELLLEALQGFLILLNKKGRVLFVSRNVEEYIGVSQAWLLGRSVVDCIHQGDVKELARQLESPVSKAAIFPETGERDSFGSKSGRSFSSARDFYLRMRQYPNGAGSRKKPGNFVLVHWRGQLRARHSSHGGSGRVRPKGLVCVCRPVQSNSVLHFRLGGNMFISRHDMRLTYTYCDPNVLYLIGYDPASLLGRTVYQFHNPLDAHKCSSCHSALIKTGTGVSEYYRFLGRTGVWVWMQTRATIVCDTRGQPQYVVCNNYIISQKEGDRCHMMDQQQQHRQPAVSASDLTAKAAIDLVTLAPVTSPTSTSSLDDDHDDTYNHDDTGYNTAVSSISSDCTSPSPVGIMGGIVGDLEPDFRFTSDFHAENSGLGLYSVTTSAVAGQDLNVLSIPASISGSSPSFQGVEIVSEDCGSDLTTNLSSEQSDPFLYSAGSGCREGGTNVMEDMELLEDLLERIADCDKTETSQSVEEDLGQKEGEGDELFGDSLSISPQSEPAAQDDKVLVDQSDKLGTWLLNPPQKPPSLLRTLLDKEGQALVERPSVTNSERNSAFPSSTNICPDETVVATGLQGKDRKCSSLYPVQQRSAPQPEKRCVPETVDLTQESGAESEGEDGSVPPALPEDLLDFAMQYCDSLADMGPSTPDTMTNLEADVWSSTMDDILATDSQMSAVPSSGKSPVTYKAPKVQSLDKAAEGTYQEVVRSAVVKRAKGLLPVSSSLSSSIQQSAAKSGCADSLTCVTSVSEKQSRSTSLAQPAVQPIVKHQGKVTVLKSSTAHGPIPSPASCRVVSPALSDHRYSTARTLSPQAKSESHGGKRLCVESDRHQSGRGLGPRPTFPIPNPMKSPSHVSIVRTPHKSGSSLPGKIIITSADRYARSASNATTVVVSQKLHNSQPTSPASVTVPANGGGKPLTAMTELEKHLRGLAAPKEHRSMAEDTLTPVGECGDTASSKPFLERLLTGEISQEGYRLIDYHLLYQERERRLSETSSSKTS